MTPEELAATLQELRSARDTHAGLLRDILRRQTIAELLVRALIDAHSDRASVARWLEAEARGLEAKMLNSPTRDRDVRATLEEIEAWRAKLGG